MSHDPELPNGFQDDDFDQRELEAAGGGGGSMSKLEHKSLGNEEVLVTFEELPAGWQVTLHIWGSNPIRDFYEQRTDAVNVFNWYAEKHIPESTRGTA